MANFVRTEQAIFYYGCASTISSTIAAFCKRVQISFDIGGETLVRNVSTKRFAWIFEEEIHLWCQYRYNWNRNDVVLPSVTKKLSIIKVCPVLDIAFGILATLLERSTADAIDKSRDGNDKDNTSLLPLSEQLQTNLATFHKQFQESKILSMHLHPTSNDWSPLLYLELQNVQKVDDNEIDLEIIAQRISHHCLMESGVAIVGTTPTRRNHGHNNNDVDNTQLFYPPEVLVEIYAQHTNQDTQKVVSALEQACQSIIIFSTTTTSSNC